MHKVTVRPCFNPVSKYKRQIYEKTKQNIKPIDFRIEKAHKNSVFR